MKNLKKLSEEEYKYIFNKVPRLCVDLIIVKNKKLLLTKRSIQPYKGFWHFPGGSVRYKERINQAIKGVSKSELGVRVVSQKFLGYMEILKDGKYIHALSLVFKCKINSKEQPKPLEQASEVRFFDKSPPKIIKEHREFLKKNLKKFN